MLTLLHPARRKLLSSSSPLLITSPSRPPSQPHSTRLSSSTISPSSNSSQASPATSQPQIIFSGIQPTGTPHLGNYLGALLPWVTLSQTCPPSTRLFFSIVDLHAITVSQSPKQLREWKKEMLRVLLALGFGGGRGEGKGGSTVFMQSHVRQHAELMWILSCTASMGYLGRMTQWKSKLELKDDASPLDEKGKGRLKLGLFSYPVLQAADILVHRATHVPVGEDQSQHLEFARECVTNFNHAYGPQLVTGEENNVPNQPPKKMSKSDPSPLSQILITDSPELIQKKLTTAVTDSQNSVSYDPVNRPGVSNLLTLLSAFDEQGRTPKELGRVYGNGTGLGAFKKLVGEAVGEGLEGFRGKYQEVVEQGDEYLVDVERRGAKVAEENAEATMVDVREAVGL